MEDASGSPVQERVVNFALLIQQVMDAKGITYNIQAQNQGIADSEVILLVESWLEAVKDNFKNNVKSGLVFGNKPPEDK